MTGNGHRSSDHLVLGFLRIHMNKQKVDTTENIPKWTTYWFWAFLIVGIVLLLVVPSFGGSWLAYVMILLAIGAKPVAMLFLILKDKSAEHHVQNEQRNVERKLEKEIAQQEVERERKQQEMEWLHQKRAALIQYKQLRQEIEKMPQYGIWRQSVLTKFGKKCAVCGDTENLEVDHRYKSFYRIVQTYGITDIIQAYGCVELWDVDNGAPLCKTHHDQTPSSRKYREHNGQKA